MRLRLLALVGALACPACGAAPPPTTPAAGGTPRWHEAPTRPAPPPPRRATRTSRPAAPPPRAAEPEPTPAEPTFLQPLVDPARTRAVVLLYHAFDVGPDPLSVSSTNLERQICWLLDSGVEIIGLGQLVDFLEGRCRLPRR